MTDPPTPVERLIPPATEPLTSSDTKPVGSPKALSSWRRKLKIFLFAFALCLGLGFIFPKAQTMPVQGATPSDWNHDTFWYHPWGRSGVHKGIDIFAKKNTPVLAATSGWVLAAEDLRNGGKTISILGPWWRIHYYAHLDSRHIKARQWVQKGQVIGEVGTSGNARGKSPHLHYTVASLVPYPWRISREKQGWKKAFFLNPDKLLRR